MREFGKYLPDLPNWPEPGLLSKVIQPAANRASHSEYGDLQQCVLHPSKNGLRRCDATGSRPSEIMRHGSRDHKIGQAQHLSDRRSSESKLINDERIDARASECLGSLTKKPFHVVDGTAYAVAQR